MFCFSLYISVFNQKSLYNAYKNRTKNISNDMDEYAKIKESDPEFYRDGSSLQYGKVTFQNNFLVFEAI